MKQYISPKGHCYSEGNTAQSLAYKPRCHEKLLPVSNLGNAVSSPGGLMAAPHIHPHTHPRASKGEFLRGGLFVPGCYSIGLPKHHWHSWSSDDGGSSYLMARKGLGGVQDPRLLPAGLPMGGRARAPAATQPTWLLAGGLSVSPYAKECQLQTLHREHCLRGRGPLPLHLSDPHTGRGCWVRRHEGGGL